MFPLAYIWHALKNKTFKTLVTLLILWKCASTFFLFFFFSSKECAVSFPAMTISFASFYFKSYSHTQGYGPLYKEIMMDMERFILTFRIILLKITSQNCLYESVCMHVGVMSIKIANMFSLILPVSY